MKPESIQKYRPFPTVDLPDRQWPDRTITHAPIWCSVDLRDGNQALPIPMSVDEKIRLFDELVRIGFKQIEWDFPPLPIRNSISYEPWSIRTASPMMSQSRSSFRRAEHLIRRTFESLVGVKKAIVHLYNSTSPLQRKITFSDASQEKIKQIAVDGAELIKELVPTLPRHRDHLAVFTRKAFRTPNSTTRSTFATPFLQSGSQLPTKRSSSIFLRPSSGQPRTFTPIRSNGFVSTSTIERARSSACTPHNDRGTGIAATELGLLAGADRVEGTLFGNGERTGNLDIVIVALNMSSHGIETGLDFSDLSSTRRIYEETTRLTVPERQPYAGELVFTAFSGSHQDAIKKGFDRRTKDVEQAGGDHFPWGVPYLTIDPQDIGRSYEAIIRINSQSGKGGVAYVLDREHGVRPPQSNASSSWQVRSMTAQTRKVASFPTKRSETSFFGSLSTMTRQ